jgi:very-short-patch-repair endonuclease
VEPDFTWLTQGIILEADGGQHAYAHLADKDRMRQAACEAAGFTVYRCTWRTYRRVVREIAEQLKRSK